MLLHIPGVHHSVPLMCTWVWFTRCLNHVSSPVVITSILARSVLWYISREVRGIKFSSNKRTYVHNFWRIQRRHTGRARPCLNFFFQNFIFENLDSITRINFIVINTLCLQCVFYSLLSLIKQRLCVKEHQNHLQTSKIIPRRERAPRF